MINSPRGPRRLWTNYLTTVANANEQQFTIITQDDFRTRYLETIFVGLATAGIQLGIYVSGQVYSTIDLSRFAAGDDVLKVDVEAPPQQQFIISLKDLAGAAHVNVPVVLGYTVDPTRGP